MNERAADCHFHVFSATSPAAAGARYRPPYAARLEDWAARREAAGVTHGVIVQPSFFGTDNAETLAAVGADPGRLRAVVVVDPGFGAEALARLHAAGARAIRLNLKGQADLAPWARAEWRALYDRVHALGWHVEVHVDTGRVPEIAPAFAGSPVAVVLDHFGTPGPSRESQEATFSAAATLARSRPVWVKLSGPYRLAGADPALLAARWLDAVGEANLVWGSDWPWTNHERENDYGHLREALDAWVGSTRARAIVWDNAARLYGLS
jgi:predicted TIM-barrel fold metal-dependent hydrolase